MRFLQTTEECQAALAYSQGVNVKNWLVNYGNIASSIYISKNHRITLSDNKVYLWDVIVGTDNNIIDAYETHDGRLLVITDQPGSRRFTDEIPRVENQIAPEGVKIDKNQFDGASP